MSEPSTPTRLVQLGATKLLLGGAAGTVAVLGSVAMLLLVWTTMIVGSSGAASTCSTDPATTTGSGPTGRDAHEELEVRGLASTYSDDPAIGWHDAMDAGLAPASGIPNTQPGIAVYNPSTLRGWWIVRAPGGATAILQQTDIGPAPSTGAVVDINAIAARTIFGVRASAFPTKQGTWSASYIGKREPAGASRPARGGPLLGSEPTGADGAAAAAACTSSGMAVSVSGPLGQRIASIASRYVGKSGRTEPFDGFEPPTFADSWCGWFATNVWKYAGVAIEVSGASFAPYTWAAAHHTLFKAAGQSPRGETPPLGSAVMYGTGPSSTATSDHVNLVTQVSRDGSYMLTGGNQGGFPGTVSTQGPCRLSRTDPGRQIGPGCDPRPIYGIAVPR
jgi:hypothetical protein